MGHKTQSSMFIPILFFCLHTWAGSTQLICDSNGHLNSIRTTGGDFKFDRDSLEKRKVNVDRLCAELTECLKKFPKEAELSKHILQITGPLISDARLSVSDQTKFISIQKTLGNSIRDCYEHQSFNGSKPKIAIAYDKVGPNRAIRYAGYDRLMVEKIVTQALGFGMDPYAVLAVLLLEHPPFSSKINGYAKMYGEVPIDGLPLSESLGCYIAKPSNKIPKLTTVTDAVEFKKLLKLENEESMAVKAASKGGNTSQVVEAQKKTAEAQDNLSKQLTPEQMRELRLLYDAKISFGIGNQSEIPKISLPWGKGAALVCTKDYALSSGDPLIFNKVDKPSGSCCANVSGLAEGDNPSVELANAMAIRFMNRKMKAKKTNNAEDLANTIQIYNGVGCLGCSETIDNKCLQNLDMRSRPYYGARAADIMVNSLMNNLEIKKIVDESSAQLGVGIPSLFCSTLGQGNKTIDENIFLNMQKKLLMNASAEMTVGTKTTSVKTRLTDGSFGVPRSTKDRELFTLREHERQKFCDNLFK